MYLKEINFREDLFSRGNFFQKLFNFRGTYFREDGNCKLSRGLNFASFARSGLFSKIQNLKTKRSNSRPIKNFEKVEILSKNRNCRALFKHK